MPLPPDIALIKVHPAIGFARLSTNDDTFVAGEPQDRYKSDNRIKRQAVQFRLFAYDAHGRGIEELTPTRLAELGLTVTWTATIGNLKIASRTTREPRYAVSASARSDQDGGQLVGACGDFAEGQQIPLGQILPDGLFIPPLAGVFRDDASRPIPDYTGMYVDWAIDNTGDGPVTAELRDSSGALVRPDVLGAWVVIAPPDFAPDFDDPTDAPGNQTLLQSLVALLNLPNAAPVTPINATARALDRSVLQRGTGNFLPGIEVSAPHRTMFADAAVTADADELRIRRKTEQSGLGAEPGELTVGLCSPWQFDFIACGCSYWPNHRPDVAFKEVPGGPRVDWERRRAGDTEYPSPDTIHTTPEYIEHVYELGIHRKVAGQRVETERDEDVE